MIEEWIIIPITREHSDEKNAANINWNFRNNGSTQERPPSRVIYPAWPLQERGPFSTSGGSCDVISLRVAASLTREAAAADRAVRPFHSGQKL